MNIFHSVIIDENKCAGCTNCIQRCPTEAIRIREGKAKIIDLRCIDCGECIRNCKNNAKKALTDELSALDDFDYKIAIPSPTLFGQFPADIPPEIVQGALKTIGFDEVYNVALGADYCTMAIREYLSNHQGPRPLLNSACPAVIRLIQVLFPDLVDLIIPIDSPIEIIAQKARRNAQKKDAGVKVGLYFITPCPAKVTAHKAPEGNDFSNIDRNIAISSIYGPLLNAIKNGAQMEPLNCSGAGLGWAKAGGENQALKIKRHLSVDGIHEIVLFLEELERGSLPPLDYIELLACSTGCVGGPLTVTNKYLARNRIRTIAEDLKTKAEDTVNPLELANDLKNNWYQLSKKLKPRPLIRFDSDVKKSMTKMLESQQIKKKLPGIDCGACGAPTCTALAEDIVNGLARTHDCIFKIREEIKDIANNLQNLSQRSYPSEHRSNK